jgi:uncharacterized protein YkwD/outer membrane protein OmpA-like peptidoglycan-associated protein
MKKLCMLVAIATLILSQAYAQKGKEKVTQTDIENKYADVSDSVNVKLLRGMNAMRKKVLTDELELNEILYKAAELQAKDMAESGDVIIEAGVAGKRVKKLGGNTNVEEIVIAMPLGKAKTKDEAQEIANAIIEKWAKSKKEKPAILNGNYVYAGISAKVDKAGKKLLISVVFGNYSTFNTGSKHRKELAVKYTKKRKGLTVSNDVKECKNCDKFKDYNELMKGVYVEGGKVYLKYKNWKALKKILGKPGDALIVDIVQRSQFDKSDAYNIMDNTMVNKGIRLKPMTAEKLMAKNKNKDTKDKKLKNELDAELGKLPKKLTGDYEINLLVMQGKKLCRTLMPSYLEEGDQDSNTPIDMLLSPDSNAFVPMFKPETETNKVSFLIPFEKNKAEYKAEDLKPFLETLDEPDFIIENLNISAYSSLEGDATNNQKLQQKRAESIVAALQSMQKDRNIKAQIKTGDTWDAFKMEQEEGTYKDLAAMKKQDAINKINSTPALLAELEPLLAKQRYAKITMNLTYDIKGDKEAKFCVLQFNKAVKKDMKQAMKIQYYLNKQVRDGKYDDSWLDKMVIDKTAANSSLLMNKVVYRYFDNNKMVGDNDAKELAEYEKLDPANKYITYNKAFAEIKTMEKLPKAGDISAIQSKIDGLYNGRIPKKYVDGVNTDLQFKVIEAYDTLENGEAMVETSINKIKQFYNFKEGSWQNALKLAYVFKRFKDYRFAAQILEPYTTGAKVNEQLLFTYLSYSAQLSDKIKSKAFVNGMNSALTLNKNRYCELFGAPKLTFQILENPSVKEQYLKSCK